MGGPEMAAHPPMRSDRPGKPRDALDIPLALGTPTRAPSSGLSASRPVLAYPGWYRGLTQP